MAIDGSSQGRSTAAQIYTEIDNSNFMRGSELYSLLDSVESEEIGAIFGLGIHSEKHDFTEHVKIEAFEGLENSYSLASLEQKTETHDSIESISDSNVSRLTNARDYRAVVTLFDELLHTPQLYHKLGCTRKRLEWLERQVGATNLSLGTTSVVPSEMWDTDTDEAREIRPEEGGLTLHLAALVDGDTKQPLAAVVTPHDHHETTQFGHLHGDVEVADDLDSPIVVIDRGYVDYGRYCELQAGGTDFVTTLRSNARTEVVERIHDVEVQDKMGTRRVTDDRIELGETGEEFRRVTVEDTDGEVTEYLTTLSAVEYDPVDVISIYTLRTLIEILFRELKQYTNVQEFHSKSFNGELFELFCTLIAYLLVECTAIAPPKRVAWRMRSGRFETNGISRCQSTANSDSEPRLPPLVSGGSGYLVAHRLNCDVMSGTQTDLTQLRDIYYSFPLLSTYNQSLSSPIFDGGYI